MKADHKFAGGANWINKEMGMASGGMGRGVQGRSVGRLNTMARASILAVFGFGAMLAMAQPVGGTPSPGGPVSPPGPTPSPCECARQQFDSPLVPGYAVPTYRKAYWDDIVSPGDGWARKAAFPPSGGITTAFESLCMGRFFPGAGPGLSDLYRNPNIELPLPSASDCRSWMAGYPLNIDLKFGPAAGTFAPRKVDVAASSSPLVPANGVAHFRGPAAYAQRPMLADTIDLITGMPLLQENDFELPFGNATFRWTRTYSEYPDQFEHQYDGSRHNVGFDPESPDAPIYAGGPIDPWLIGSLDFQPMQLYWDWVGQGWMLGVNPIFYIDDTEWGTSYPIGRPRCSFMPDAHHSIPFDLVEDPDDRQYEAPPRFDAVLEHNGEGNEEGWVKRPTWFKVYMHNKSVIYTIKPVYEDVGKDWEGDSFHRPPSEQLPDNQLFVPYDGSGDPHPEFDVSARDEGKASLGVPYYGVVTQIADTQGNVIDIEYEDFERVDRNDPATACHEVWQLGQQKGQIKRIRLFASGSTAPAWTIIPVYRTFGGNDTRLVADPYVAVGTFGLGPYYFDGFDREDSVPEYYDQKLNERFETQRAISSIFVYAGDVPLPSQKLLIPWEDFTNYTPIPPSGDPNAAVVHALGEIAAVELPQGVSLPSNWAYKVNYLYADNDPIFSRTSIVQNPGHQANPPEYGFPILLGSPRLIMTTVHRAAVETGETKKEHVLYQYRTKLYALLAGYFQFHYQALYDDHWGLYDSWAMRAIWKSQTLESLRSALLESEREGEPALASEDQWPFSLFVAAHRETRRDGASTYPVVNGAGSDEEKNRKPLVEFADIQMEPWTSPAGGNASEYYRGTRFKERDSAFRKEMMGFGGSAFGLGDLIVDSSEIPQPMVTYLTPQNGPAVFLSRSGEKSRNYRLYHFVARPNTEGWTAFDDLHRVMGASDSALARHWSPLRTILHEPFLQCSDTGALADGATTISIDESRDLPDMANPCWMSVIDEYEKYEHATMFEEVNMDGDDGPYEQPVPDTSPKGFWDRTISWYKGGAYRNFAPITRRIVIMNAAGYVLLDRTWDLKKEEVTATTGLTQQLVYDWQVPSIPASQRVGRVVERRTYGWSAEDNKWLAGDPTADPEGQGLIYTYKYPPVVLGERPSMSIAAVGVKNGTGGTPYWTQQFIRETGIDETLRFQVDFVSPVTDSGLLPFNLSSASGNDLAAWASQGKNVTATLVLREGAGPTPKRVAGQITIRPPSAIEPAPRGGPASPLYCPIEITKNTYPSGLVESWTGRGLVRTDAVPDASAWSSGLALTRESCYQFLMDLNRQGGRGTFSLSVMDYGDGSSVAPYVRMGAGLTSNPPQRPSSWQRFTAPGASELTALPLESWTYSESDPAFGPKRIMRGGRDAGDVTGDYYTYKDEVTPPDYLQEDEVVFEQRVYSQVIFDPSSGLPRDPKMPGSVAYSRDGQPLGMSQVTWTAAPGAPITGEELFTSVSDIKVQLDGSGQVTKVEVAGSDGAEVKSESQIGRFGEIARQLDPDGTITRTVSDPLGRPEHVYRGTNDDHVYWGTRPPGLPSYADNLVLLEKSYYGLDTHDARRLVGVRRYREKPQDQYLQYDASGQPIGDPNEDEIGWLESYGYDWRMRRVSTTFTQDAADGGAVVSTTYTYMDHANRPVLVATYGGSAPTGGVDPRALAPGQGVTAVQVLAASPAPLRLHETIYNARGQVQEERSYKVDDPTGASYLSTFTFYDNLDRAVYSLSPGSGEHRSFYDAKGRMVQSSVFAGGVELSRTQTIFNDKGNAVAVSSTERRHDAAASPAALTSSNSITSHSYSWYDEAGRMTISAELGTGSSADVFGPPGTPLPSRLDPSLVAPSYTASANYPVAISTGGLPASARVSFSKYDDKGRLVESIRPDGTAVRYAYNSFGQKTLESEIGKLDSAQPSLNVIRQKAYEHENGKVIRIGTRTQVYGAYSETFDWTSPGVQITKVAYGADITDRAGSVISRNNGYVGSVDIGRTGVTSTDTNDLTYTYFQDGTLASRLDGRGVKHSYLHDSRGNLTRVTVNEGSSLYGSLTPPSDRILRLDMGYDNLSQLLTVTGYKDTSGSTVAAQSSFAYDVLGHLTEEAQAVGTAVQSNSPRVSYQWLFASAGPSGPPAAPLPGIARLEQMRYPAIPGGSARRTLNFSAGSALGDISSALDRITKVSDASLGNLALYDFAGTGRRVGKRYGANTAGTTYALGQFADDSSSGTLPYEHLDSFGRTKSQVFASSAGNLQRRDDAKYDLAGNRTSSRITLAQDSQGTHDNDRSFLYSYDGLMRLTRFELGQLNGTGTAITAGTSRLATSFNLDALDQRQGDVTKASTDPAYYGQIVSDDLDGDGTPASRYTATTYDALNHETQRLETATPGSGTLATAPQVYDKAGNLVADARNVYVHDGWNRLSRVHQRGTATFDADGHQSGGVIGPVLAEYGYDAVGRLAIKKAPLPAIGGIPQQRTERYVYEGIRRIQEIRDDQGTASPSSSTAILEREYVWAPGGSSGSFIDELICQVRNPGQGGSESPYYAIQDGSFSLTGLVDGTGKVAAQYTLDPYGSVLYASYPAPAQGGSAFSGIESFNHLGHQGLFFDRLDVPGATGSGATGGDPTQIALQSQLASGSAGLYQNRNRFYQPAEGRFVEQDPNETGMVLLSQAMHGGIGLSGLSGFNADLPFGNGLNLYGAYMGMPLSSTDALGLFPDFGFGGGGGDDGGGGGGGPPDFSGERYDPNDPFNMVDDFNAERAGQVAAFMENLTGTFNTAAFIAMQIGQLHPAVAAAASIANIASGNWDAWDIVNLVPGGSVAGIIGKSLGAFAHTKGAYAAAGLVGVFGKRASRAGELVADFYQHVYKRGTYREMQKLTAGYKGEIQAHHILEARHARAWLLDENSIPAVVLTRAEHAAISKKLSQALPTGERYSPQRVLNAYQQVYSQYPGEWLQSIMHYLQK